MYVYVLLCVFVCVYVYMCVRVCVVVDSPKASIPGHQSEFRDKKERVEMERLKTVASVALKRGVSRVHACECLCACVSVY